MINDVFTALFNNGYSIKIEVWLKDLHSHHPAIRSVAHESLNEFVSFFEKNQEMVSDCTDIRDSYERVVEELKNVLH